MDHLISGADAGVKGEEHCDASLLCSFAAIG